MRVFGGDEEESLVLPDRPAEHGSELIAAIIRDRRAGPVRGPTVRIESGVAQEVVGVAVELVGSGLGHHVDHRAARLSIFGPEEIRLHLELLDRVHRWRPLQVRGAAVLLGDIHQRAIHQHIRRGVARAVGHEVGVGGVERAARARHAGCQVQQAQWIAPDVGERHHVTVLDHLPQSRNRGVEQRRLAQHFHGSSEFTHLHRHVEGGLLLHGQGDVGLGVPLETLGFHVERILAGRERRHGVAPRIVHDHGVRNVAIGLGKGDFGARHRSSAGVADYAAHRGRIRRLRPCQAGSHKRHTQQLLDSRYLHGSPLCVLCPGGILPGNYIGN